MDPRSVFCMWNSVDPPFTSSSFWDLRRFAALLLVFFSTSSKVTRLGEAKKRATDADFKEGGQRNW